MQGRIDVVTQEGLVEGWCWNEAVPNEKIGVTVLIDGVEAGSTLAAHYRDDLRQAKIGDGFHAFSFMIQTPTHVGKRTQTFTKIENETRKPIGEPVIYYSRDEASFDDRLSELETRSGLISTRLEELMERAERSSSFELFAVVGAFFTRLSQNVARNEPISIDGRLSEILRTATRNHPLIKLSTPEHSTMTILIHATGLLPQIRACLKSLQHAKVEMSARVVVLDSGREDELALIPSLVRGITYIRTVADLCSEWSEIANANSSDIIVALSDRVLVSNTWLDEIAHSFASNTNAGAIGSHAAGAGGVLRHGGLCIREGLVTDCGLAGHPESLVDLVSSYPADALSYQAAAFRLSALRAVGGLDASFGNDLGVAIIDACFRLRLAGWFVLVQPFATVEMQSSHAHETWIAAACSEPSRAGDLLRSRWFDSDAKLPSLFLGCAAVLGMGAPTSIELHAVHRLREAGYKVLYLAANELTIGQVSALRRSGAFVIAEENVAKTLALSNAGIIFAEGESALFGQRPTGCQIAIGLDSLKEILMQQNGAGAAMISDALSLGNLDP